MEVVSLYLKKSTYDPVGFVPVVNGVFTDD